MDDQQSQGDKLKAVASLCGEAEDAGEELAELVDDQLADAATMAKESDKQDLSVIEVTANGAGGQNAVAGTGTPGNEMIETLGYTSVGSGVQAARILPRISATRESSPRRPTSSSWPNPTTKKWGGEEGLWEAFPSAPADPCRRELRDLRHARCPAEVFQPRNRRRSPGSRQGRREASVTRSVPPSTAVSRRIIVALLNPVSAQTRKPRGAQTRSRRGVMMCDGCRF